MQPDFGPLIYVMTAAIVVAAVAILVQTGFMYAMYKASNQMKAQMAALSAKAEPLIAKAGPILDNSQKVVEQTRAQLGELGGKATEILDLSQKQLVRLDGVLAEAADRTRVQMDRIEMVVDDTVNRFQETTALLHNGILKPVRQLNGLAAGMGAALGVLMRPGRTTPEHATHDEEMFI